LVKNVGKNFQLGPGMKASDFVSMPKAIQKRNTANMLEEEKKTKKQGRLT
jgi:hypothetical protein